MNLSDEGLNFIESFEGYERKMPDGRCQAYREEINGKLDIPTIGFGCTEGVEMGMIWTREEADAAFKKELVKHEAAVNRFVTSELTQHQFDALCSFSYNCGADALRKSTLLKRVNLGDFEGAAKAFAQWNKFGGKPSKGLTHRRAAEAALFLKPDVHEGSPMPQSPEARSSPPSRTAIATASMIGAPSVLEVMKNPPDLSAITQWQSAGEVLSSAATFLTSHKWAALALVIGVTVLIIKDRVLSWSDS